MKINCKIIIDEEIDLIKKVFEAEDKKFRHNRSEYVVKKVKKLNNSNNKEQLIIEINANDPTALRATITSITRILNIVRKTHE